MRRRQMYQMQAMQASAKVDPTNFEPVALIVDVPKKEEKKSYKAGKCPNCGKHIAKGMYFHLKGCHG